MPWGVAAAAVIGYAAQSNAANKAANAQKGAAAAANQQLEQNYNRTEQNLNPYIGAGTNALTGLEALNNGNYTGFQNSPDYLYAQQQQLQGLDRSAASRGSIYSGGHSYDILAAANGLASQNLGNYRNSLMGLVNAGQNAASNLGSVGTGNAASIGSNLMASGNAQANGYINQANSTSNLLGQLAGAYGQYQSQNSSSYIPATGYQDAPGAGAPQYSSSDITWQ